MCSLGVVRRRRVSSINKMCGLGHVHTNLMMVFFVAYIVERLCFLGHVHTGVDVANTMNQMCGLRHVQSGTIMARHS